MTWVQQAVMPRAAFALMVGLLLVGCGTTGPTEPAASSVATATSSPVGPADAPPAATAAPPVTQRPGPSAVATPVDLAARPLTWFAPLPPMPGRSGSPDFMAQFEPGAAWATAAGHVQVYKLYGEWVAYHATPDQLRRAVADIARRGMALAVEAGPLDAPASCGGGVESFAGRAEGRLIASRVQAAGGRIDILALDEPYFFAHVYDGAGACHWPLDAVAAGVVAYRDEMRQAFPAVVIGDTEPLPAPVAANGLADWLDAYRAAGGEPFGFLHLDPTWSRPGWPALAQAVAAAARARDVPVGMIYNGGGATDRATWIAQAGAHVKAFEAAGPPPDHVLFQSWMSQPDAVLPDTDPTSFSGLVVTYFADHAALGAPPAGPANLALGRPAKASMSLAGSPPGDAVDGDQDTLWNSGGGPPQWIEIDLGKATAVAEIRLTVSQYPAGSTDHRVYARLSDGSLVLLHRFHGRTRDGDVLEFAPATPRTKVRAIRVETRASPSWVAWREIEVLAP
jgi:hypothetical protein